MTAASPGCRLDHIAVTAPDLARGASYVSDVLGVPLSPGGEHPAMATHNRLLRLGDAIYLEVIAPNPAAPRPARRRWFGLDEAGQAGAPRLAAWVARTGDIHAAVRAACEPLGDIEPLRRGALRWSMTVPPDGGLILGGAAPMLIEWHAGGEVASRLADVGCRLRRLEVCHPEAHRAASLLGSIGLADAAVAIAPLAAGQRPYLVAHIDTPSGPRQLGGPAGLG